MSWESKDKDPLVMCVSNPWEGAHDRNGNEEVCRHTGDQNRVVLIPMVDENENYAEKKPCAAWGRAAAVNAAQMLQDWGAAQAPP